MKYLLIILFLCVSHKPLQAHDQWANGQPIPEWIKKYCCGPQDVHMYRPSDVKVTWKGYKLPDYPHIIPFKRDGFPAVDWDKSEDGMYWAFWTKYSENSYSSIYCFFIPPASM